MNRLRDLALKLPNNCHCEQGEESAFSSDRVEDRKMHHPNLAEVYVTTRNNCHSEQSEESAFRV